MASASVKSMAHQYYHSKDREQGRLKEKSKLETVEDASERIREDEESSKAEYYDKMVDSEANDIRIDQQIREENLEKETTYDREIESSSLSLASDLEASKSTSVKITNPSAIKFKRLSASSESDRFYTSKDIRPLTVPFDFRLSKKFTAGTP